MFGMPGALLAFGVALSAAAGCAASPDFERGLKEIKPSTGTWFQTAKNVAMFANDAGEYDELVDYLRRNKLV